MYANIVFLEHCCCQGFNKLENVLCKHNEARFLVSKRDKARLIRSMPLKVYATTYISCIHRWVHLFWCQLFCTVLSQCFHGFEFPYIVLYELLNYNTFI